MKKLKDIKEVRNDIDKLRSKICCSTNELGLGINDWYSIDYHLACIEKLIYVDNK